MTNMHAAIQEEKLTEAYRLLLEMRENCAKHADDQYDDPKREAKCEALNIAMTAMGRSIPSRWIPVKERLPEDGVDVVIRYGKDGFCEVASRSGENWHCAEYVVLGSEWITHWMPLPEPPEEVRHE